MASSTQKKTTTKKSGSRSGSRTAKGKQPQKRPIRREVGGVILLVLALCVLVSYCGVQAILIDLLAKLLKGLFGYGYWLACCCTGAARSPCGPPAPCCCRCWQERCSTPFSQGETMR